MHVIDIKSNVRDYKVYFDDTAGFMGGITRFKDAVYVIDENVWAHHADGCLKDIPRKDAVVIPVNEDRKCIGSVEELYDLLMDRAAKKNMTMISIGGGITQDITGFAASTLYRGINWVFVPTTLLAQADSCIGSKTSLNYKSFKNLVGTFYPPSEVYIHSPFLSTLEKVDFYSGLGEVVKLHLMGGADAARRLTGSLPDVLAKEPASLMSAVRESLRIKLSYMEGDEFDAGRRNLLNFGHCFGHALESVSAYDIPHGQAVIIGMLFANFASVKRGLMAEDTGRRIAEELLFKTIVSPVKGRDLDEARILEAMKKDKKRVGEGLVVVMLKDDYTLEKVTDFTTEELGLCLARLRQSLEVRA